MDIFAVAPLVSAWIEIDMIASFETGEEVAPLVGAWIEMEMNLNLFIPGRRKCGDFKRTSGIRKGASA